MLRLYASVLLCAILLISGVATAQHASKRPTAQEFEVAIVAFQQTLNTEYRNPTESPLPPEAREKFTGLAFFPSNYSACVLARFVRDSLQAPFPMPTSTVRRPLYQKYGELHFTLEGKRLQLTVYQSLDLLQKPGYQDYLFVPFTDQTNGRTSYGGGRYIDLRLGQIQQGQVVVDFNQAYNPFCAYSPQYSCPVPPIENRLPVAIKAGVMSDH
ncbi:hypothetical protein SAMN06265337_3907 [Hymenobacter gelipurpurascens]|uniref:DUF1684 domain-containing protein n=1 Tax=Hymenobacter gelipurpurascens TaxID=89968 RepID=A0A212UGY5_9BACT|nr:DUF1684 domain-containing protein [Hymenobacter gelipurpurascens]SNC77324.1 hypothetical protein SAMN06265337_3907 [Hymenobacter gelipurpurascens]